MYSVLLLKAKSRAGKRYNLMVVYDANMHPLKAVQYSKWDEEATLKKIGIALGECKFVLRPITIAPNELKRIEREIIETVRSA